MIAWCAKCSDAMECDGRGCIVCAVLLEKRRERYGESKRIGMREMHGQRKLAGRCINGRNHAEPSLKRDGSRYTRCEPCRATHRRTW